MATSRKVWIHNQRTALYLGVGLTVAGALAIFDAYEHRGLRRPLPLWFLGLVT